LVLYALVGSKIRSGVAHGRGNKSPSRFIAVVVFNRGLGFDTRVSSAVLIGVCGPVGTDNFGRDWPPSL
jgi:hypothetical protein